MSEMIERVARAITRTAEIEHDEGNRDNNCEVRLRNPHAVARAALAEIREPTEAMCKAGHDANDPNEDVCTDCGAASDAVRWRAMIDEALK